MGPLHSHHAFPWGNASRHGIDTFSTPSTTSGQPSPGGAGIWAMVRHPPANIGLPQNWFSPGIQPRPRPFDKMSWIWAAIPSSRTILDIHDFCNHVRVMCLLVGRKPAASKYHRVAAIKSLPDARTPCGPDCHPTFT